MKLQFFLIVFFMIILTTYGYVIIELDYSNFQRAGRNITFSEFPLTTENPVYNPQNYGSPVGPVVTFRGWFVGQSLGDNSTCPNITKPELFRACLQGNPTNPLTLDPRSSDTMILFDPATVSTPILSASPVNRDTLYIGPISILFSFDVAAVAFQAGWFDSDKSTLIKLFGRDGTLLGQLTNKLGSNLFAVGLDGTPSIIAGVQLSMQSNEPEGFGIDNLNFGLQSQLSIGPSSTPSLTPSETPSVSVSPSRRSRTIGGNTGFVTGGGSGGSGGSGSSSGGGSGGGSGSSSGGFSTGSGGGSTTSNFNTVTTGTRKPSTTPTITPWYPPKNETSFAYPLSPSIFTLSLLLLSTCFFILLS
jgi:hypothetical protein